MDGVDLRERPTLLKVAGVTKRYGSVTALDGVSLTVEQGEFVCLLGPNGAGKSTLFQILSGLFSADSGQVVVLDRDMKVAPVAALSRIGIVFQQPTLDIELSVMGNLLFHARLHGLPNDFARPRIAEELARVGLSDQANVRAGALSGGNRRRVELARAVLHEPALLLMDEPTVGLDPASRADILAHVRSLCRERDVGVLWSTHLIDEAEGADRIVLLHRGRVLRNSSPREMAEGAESLSAAFLAITGERTDAPAAA
jgi:ABC-2 type transport system ATP-binding protein